MPSLADKIRAYIGDPRSNAEIAKLLGCRTTYVRVIRNQRGQAAFSKYDARYLKRKWGTPRLSEARAMERASYR